MYFLLKFIITWSSTKYRARHVCSLFPLSLSLFIYFPLCYLSLSRSLCLISLRILFPPLCLCLSVCLSIFVSTSPHLGFLHTLINLYFLSSRREPGRVAQSVGHLIRKSWVLGSIPGLATYFRFSFRFFKKGSCQLLAKVCARSTG